MGEDDTAQAARDTLPDIEQRGAARGREYAIKLDGWDREIIVSPGEVGAAMACGDGCPGTSLILPARGVPRHTVVRALASSSKCWRDGA